MSTIIDHGVALMAWMQLHDSAFPAGRLVHSHGLEEWLAQRPDAGPDEVSAAVIDYVVSRYGDFVLLRPPVKAVTLVLWFGPIVIALIGVFGIILFFRRQKKYAAQLEKETKA